MEQRHDLGDQRQLVTIAVLTTLGGCEPQLEADVNAALNVGLAPCEIVEATVHCAPYTGFPRTLNAIFVARDVLEAAA
jgi:4-carboxymuconolactone decarboxylase